MTGNRTGGGYSNPAQRDPRKDKLNDDIDALIKEIKKLSKPFSEKTKADLLAKHKRLEAKSTELKCNIVKITITKARIFQFSNDIPNAKKCLVDAGTKVKMFKGDFDKELASLNSMIGNEQEAKKYFALTASDPRSMLNHAHSLMRAKEYSTAKQLLDKLLKEVKDSDPLYHKAMLALGRCYSSDELKQYQQACDIFLKLYENKLPDEEHQEEIAHLLGHVYHLLGQFDRAVEFLKRNKTYASQKELAYSLAKLEQHKEAIKIFECLREQKKPDDTNELAYALARGFAAIKQYEKAVELLLSCPTYLARLALGRCYEDMGQADKAIIIFQELSQSKQLTAEQNAEVNLTWGRALQKAHRLDEAMTQLVKVKNYSGQFAIAHLHVEKREFKQAVDLYLKLLEQEKNNLAHRVEISQALAQCYQQSDQRQDVENVLRTIDAPEMRFGLAIHCQVMGKLSEAEAIFSRLENEEKDVKLREKYSFALTRFYSNTGQTIKAVNRLRDAKTTEEQLSLACIYVAEEDYSAALTILNKLEREQKEDGAQLIDVKLAQAECYKSMKSYDKAMEILKNCPDYRAKLKLGFCFLEKEDAQTAISLFQQLLKAEEKNHERCVEINHALAQAYAHCGQIDNALKILQKEGHTYAAQLQRIRCYDDAGQLDQARDALEELSREVKNDPKREQEVAQLLGEVFISMKKFPEALQQFLPLNDSSSKLRAAVCYREMMLYPEAIALLKEQLSVRAGGKVSGMLAKVYRKNNQFEDAITLLTSRHDLHNQIQLVISYREMREFDKAIALSKTLLAKTELPLRERDWILIELAACYQLCGQDQAALKVIQLVSSSTSFTVQLQKSFLLRKLGQFQALDVLTKQMSEEYGGQPLLARLMAVNVAEMLSNTVLNLEQFFKKFPYEANIGVALAWRYKREKDFVKAEELLVKLRENFPFHRPTAITYATFMTEQHCDPLVIIDVIKQFPMVPELQKLLGDCYFARHDYDAAYAQYEKVKKDFPRYEGSYVALAKCLIESGAFSRATEFVLTHLGLKGANNIVFPYSAELNELYLRLLLNAKKVQEAQEQFIKCANLFVGNTSVLEKMQNLLKEYVVQFFVVEKAAALSLPPQESKRDTSRSVADAADDKADQQPRTQQPTQFFQPSVQATNSEMKKTVHTNTNNFVYQSLAVQQQPMQFAPVQMMSSSPFNPGGLQQPAMQIYWMQTANGRVPVGVPNQQAQMVQQPVYSPPPIQQQFMPMPVFSHNQVAQIDFALLILQEKKKLIGKKLDDFIRKLPQKPSVPKRVANSANLISPYEVINSALKMCRAELQRDDANIDVIIARITSAVGAFKQADPALVFVKESLTSLQAQAEDVLVFIAQLDRNDASVSAVKTYRS